MLTFDGWLNSGGKRQDVSEDGGWAVGDLFLQICFEASPLQLQLRRLMRRIGCRLCKQREREQQTADAGVLGSSPGHRFTDAGLTLQDPDQVRSLRPTAGLTARAVVSLDTDRVKVCCT